MFCLFLTFVHLFQVRASQCSPLAALGGRRAGQSQCNSKFRSSCPPLCCRQVNYPLLAYSRFLKILSQGMFGLRQAPYRLVLSVQVGEIWCLEEDDFCGHTSSQVFPWVFPSSFLAVQVQRDLIFINDISIIWPSAPLVTFPLCGTHSIRTVYWYTITLVYWLVWRNWLEHMRSYQLQWYQCCMPSLLPILSYRY